MTSMPGLESVRSYSMRYAILTVVHVDQHLRGDIGRPTVYVRK